MNIQQMSNQQIEEMQANVNDEINRREMAAVATEMRRKVVFENIRGSCTCHRCMEGAQSCGIEVEAVSVSKGWEGGQIIGWHSTSRMDSITVRDSDEARKFVANNGKEGFVVSDGVITIDEDWPGWDTFDVESHWADEVSAWRAIK